MTVDTLANHSIAEKLLVPITGRREQGAFFFGLKKGQKLTYTI